MATSKWEAAQTAENALTTELNSLANGSRAISGTAVSNDTEKDFYASIELYLATQGSARSSGAYVALYIVYSHDGSNFSIGDASVAPSIHSHIANVDLDAATTARYVVIPQVLLAPLDFKIVVENRTGQALASSGNTVKIRRYNVEGT